MGSMLMPKTNHSYTSILIDAFFLMTINGIVLSQLSLETLFSQQKLQNIKTAITEQSRKLTISTYENQTIRTNVEGFQIYYKIYSQVIFLMVTSQSHNINFINDIFNKIINTFQKDIKKIANSSVLNGQSSIYHQLAFKNIYMQFQQMIQSFTSLPRKQPPLGFVMQQFMQYNLKTIAKKQEEITSYQYLNQINQKTYIFRNWINTILIVEYAKVVIVYVLFVLSTLFFLYICINFI